MTYFYDMETGNRVSIESIYTEYCMLIGTNLFNYSDFVQFVHDSFIEENEESVFYINSLINYDN